jgi:ubiquitin carboxyl-terminal hydrolase L5
MVPDLFFARQVITNACATQAILSVLLNVDGIEIGDKLNEFKEFTQAFDAEMKGEAISNSDMIKEAHNSFARPEPFGIDESKKPTSGKGDAYHFIAFVPFKGTVYELDGLKGGPISIGTYLFIVLIFS